MMRSTPSETPGGFSGGAGAKNGRTLVVAGPSSFTDTDRISRAIEWAVGSKDVRRIACTGSMEKYVWPIADRLGVEIRPYRAEYRQYGPVGAIVRNVHMLEDANPDMVFGFSDTLDENTADLMRRVVKNGVPTYLISTTIVAPPAVPPPHFVRTASLPSEGDASVEAGGDR